ncbi:MAG TPA: carbohydrate porin [Gammaproteobacteria bacterium]
MLSLKRSLLALSVGAALAASAARADGTGDTTLSGLMFVDMTDIQTQKNGADVDPDGFGLDVKRFYFGVNHAFDETWSATLITDFDLPKLSVSGKDSTGATVSSTGTASETQVFIKKAYLQGHFSDAATLRVGSADMPWIPFVENIYGYRFVEKTLLDRLKFGNTVDWGAHGFGRSGGVNYAASLVNGGGFKNPGRSKGMDVEARLGFMPVDGLTLAMGGYSGKLGQDTDAVPAQHTASRVDAMAAWKASGLTVGGEYFSADNYTTVLSAAPDKADGWSLFGSYDLTSDHSVFARYDRAKTSKDLNPSLTDTYYHAGFAWRSSPNLTWALAYKSDKLADNATELKTQEFGVWAQIKF